MNKIKEARKAAGLSQKYVALALGVAGPSVSNWESGKTQPTPDNLKALANLFNVSVDYLLGLNDASPTMITRLRDLRESHGVRQSEVAEAINCSQAVYSRYENGERTPSPDTIKALANFFGVTVDYLLGVDNPISANLLPDVSGSMRATPDMRVAVTGPDGMTQTLLHETLHYMGNPPSQATQREKLAVLERDIREALNPQRAARIAEATEILQSMTDEEYQMALNILRAMKK